ncbi:hypothetical protein ACMGD3_10545 [Lysinibacillus sphaericus]|uniref:hypothetical protein n=1 Tax=Lysinibacillus sphaericus TaxID=1421 RepID=UPI003F7A701B
MKNFIIVISIMLILVSLFFMATAFLQTESRKEKLLIVVFVFVEPLDALSITFYLSLVGLMAGLFIF